ncbi:lasso peptide biosynthesis PqqD family chaperone [Streptomyces sp. NPDC003006]
MSITLRPGILITETEYGMVLLDQHSGEYYTLNPTAALILRTLLDSSMERAVDELTTTYDISPGAADQDITRIAGELRSAGLLVS